MVAHLIQLLRQEESFYLQKSRVTWIKEGDLNTSYFHKQFKVRKAFNKVSCIKLPNGSIATEEEDISNAMVTFYKELIGTARITGNHADPAVIQSGPVLETSEISRLRLPVTDKEIKSALWSINEVKAPGVDGYGSFFFKHCWNIVGEDFCAAVKEFFQSGKLLKQVNVTALVIIPKNSNPQGLGDFRPIACCTVIYKTITKILTSRLAPVLKNLISANQSAFVPGRCISDNILLAHELVRNYHRVSSGSNCALKVDLQKAYDTIDWDFLEEILLQFGFPNKFITWIMVCLRNSCYSIVLNGGLSSFFPGAHGVRQGDPMSPLLFVLCMEYLSRLLKLWSSHGFKFHKGCTQLRLNHLCFAHDLFLFSKGDVSSVTLLIECLQDFSSVSGLKVNFSKSNVFVSSGVPSPTKTAILDVTGFQEGFFPIKYLGMPLLSTKLSKQDCSAMVDKVTKRIDSWGARNLSYAGRLQLITAVLRSLTVYWASIFVLPAAVINSVDRKCRAFLWSGSSSSSKALVAWKSICKPKKEGGLGILDLKSWNKAAIGKHIWDIISEKSSLWAKWIIANKLKKLSFWGITKPLEASWSWRKLVQLRECFRGKFSYSLGDGTSFRFWTDPWMSGSSLIDKFPSIDIADTSIPFDAKVAVFGEEAWQEVDHWRPISGKSDSVCWLATKSGRYSTASAMEVIRDVSDLVPWFRIIWGKGYVPRYSFIAWIAMHNRLNVRSRLLKMGIVPSATCELCKTAPETLAHLFFDCPITRAIWRYVAGKCMLATVNMNWWRISSWLCRKAVGHSLLSQIRRLAFTSTIYHIWNARNRFYL
ncbi:Retrovirus-related Pol polyprotein from type-1 retrotransposable element R2 [Euphorbia peplus]|nr:Retrovirus-related Pol polyprotein from type-1 retrotransposable element R2 [Euphorbia peplus]